MVCFLRLLIIISSGVHAAWFLGHLKHAHAKLRIRGRSHGFGEVIIGGEWRRVCFHNWEAQLTTAVCRSAGYTNGAARKKVRRSTRKNASSLPSSGAVC